MMKIDRFDFELFLEASGDHVFVTCEINSCPLAQYLQYMLQDDGVWVSHDTVTLGDGITEFPLPEWAQAFSALDEIGNGREMAAFLRGIE